MPLNRGGRPGLLGTIARTAVISGTAQATSNAVNRRARARSEREYAAANVPEQMPPPPPPAPPQPAAGAPAGGATLADQIGRLADLHASGVLTDEEFAAAKSRLLT
ncbi:SHOCT domain-containing protein [Arthrobacter sp. Sa2CUA1]|uniref:SHOCT domain-containing protein n=1 Tax=Arthrobacter gallicola TaxID=2762225 RepID=A0ABR8UN20_9MICC|nr:SHOCT domain-containing protein [Arthrobacter gallicola]MBD7993953.1 SHOCT domain-containing protein [Arthrobacter gallicola]